VCRKRGARRKQHIPGAYVLAHTPITKGSQDKLGMLYHASLDGLRRGRGTHDLWQNLADAINVSLCFAENNGVMTDHATDIRKAQDALVACRYRFKKSDKWGMTGDEAKAVMRGLAIYDEQNATATVSQQLHSLAEVRVRLEIGDTR
jgi:hypothetical protein